MEELTAQKYADLAQQITKPELQNLLICPIPPKITDRTFVFCKIDCNLIRCTAGNMVNEFYVKSTNFLLDYIRYFIGAADDIHMGIFGSVDNIPGI